MSDARARDLERNAARTGTVQDRAAALRARTRAGTLLPERLELAAYLGHDAALAAIGWTCREAQGCDSGREERPMWCRACAWRDAPTGYLARGLARFGQVDCVHVAVDAARLALAAGCRHRTHVVDRALNLIAAACESCRVDERVISAADDWVRCPCDAHYFAARHASERASLWAVACAQAITADLNEPASPLVSCLNHCAARGSATTFRAELADAVAAWALA